MLDHEHLLSVDVVRMNEKFTAYLAKLDLLKMQISVIDSKVFAGHFRDLIFDPENQHSFAVHIIYDRNDQHYFHVVAVKNSHLECTNRFEVRDFDRNLCMTKLKGTQNFPFFNSQL
jgi:hypothetical protein